MKRRKRCAYCTKKFTPNPKAKTQKFCGKRCRERCWIEANREAHNATVRRYRRRRYEEEGTWLESGPKAKALKAWMIELKSKPCHDCGHTFPTCCMDFDHRRGTRKNYNLGSMFAHHYSRALIRRELRKCDLVCSNCHRIRTRDRKTGQPRSKRVSPARYKLRHGKRQH